MPKKRNFLGGMQNYDPANGQYEPNLTTASGEQATPENVPGGENKKGFKSFTKNDSFEKINAKRMGNKFADEEDDGRVQIGDKKLTLEEFADVVKNSKDKQTAKEVFLSKANDFGMTENEAEEYFDTEIYGAADSKTQKNDSLNDINKKRMGTTDHKEEDLDSRIEKVIKERVKQGWDGEGTFDVQAVKDTGYYGFGSIEKLEENTFGKKDNGSLDISSKLKTVRNKEFGFKHYDLSEDILTEVYNYFSGDEDEMLDYLRNYDFGMTSGDLQGVIEVFRPKNK